MIRRVGLLIGGTLVCWVALSYPAWRVGGTEALTYSCVAALLCLVPTVGTLLLAARGQLQSSHMALVLILAGSGIRMGVVLSVGLIICLAGLPGLPEVQVMHFWIWVLVYYLATLGLEVALILAGQAPRNHV